MRRARTSRYHAQMPQLSPDRFINSNELISEFAEDFELPVLRRASDENAFSPLECPVDPLFWIM